ncbi:venom protease-like [Chelonus insularis]|uniref:venom protease-like n=1 Tax=Chelonus insularis TaxID=460826 RepID=UPI00158D917E|nr:venom protease-like [Chelonus insularis]
MTIYYQENCHKNICGYNNYEPIVCCNSNKRVSTTWSPPTTTTRKNTEFEWKPLGSNTRRPTRRPSTTSTTTEFYTHDESGLFPMSNQNSNKNNGHQEIRRKVGDLAKEKCAEYASLVYTTVIPPTLTGNRKPVNESTCAIKSQKLIVGGKKAAPKEFPLMAAVGFNSNPDNDVNYKPGKINWLCGGTLVSDKFVMTAAHCIYSIDYGYASWIRVGDLNLEKSDDNARPQERKIVERISHPDYRKPLEYHDIALLRMERPIVFNSWVRPACLSTNTIPTSSEYGRVQETKALAIGWGRVDWADEEGSNDLLKVTLPIVPHKRCNESFIGGVADYKLKFGIVDQWQMCAGQEGKDTCQGDSGGPLVVFSNNHKCMYDVIGITSLGRLCGSIVPGVYTRVSNYISWLEDTIWSN